MKKSTNRCECGKLAAKGRTKCSCCLSRERRKKYPLKVAYYTLKSNAKRRGKYFDLTYEQFVHFAIKTEYRTKRGRFKNSYHIDRINEDLGYTISNIQVLTNTDNVIKYKKCKCYIDENGKHFYTETYYEQSNDSCPF